MLLQANLAAGIAGKRAPWQEGQHSSGAEQGWGCSVWTTSSRRSGKRETRIFNCCALGHEAENVSTIGWGQGQTAVPLWVAEDICAGF